MPALLRILPKAIFVFAAVFLLATAQQSHNTITLALVMVSLVMFAACWANASSLFGPTAALKFVGIAVSLGWFAEHMGVTQGWFFGRYRYTEVLGWPLGDVPLVIPLMWFVLCYVGYSVANFAVWQSPVEAQFSRAGAMFMSFLAAMVVTAYDLAADPYMVYHLKAWIMAKTDGWWFGETLEGFVGWVFVSFVIIFSFRLAAAPQSPRAPDGFTPWHALLPLAIYGFSMLFQAFMGTPVETRTVAVFAMGIPLLCALAGWWRWKTLRDKGADGGADAVLSAVVPDARLNQMRYQADPLADATMASLLGPWPLPVTVANSADRLAAIAQINRQFDSWLTNQSINNWHCADTNLPPAIALGLQRYLQAGQTLPAWADRAKIERAEVLFSEYGALSCSLLFCSSLPECYVIPDLSAVLHMAGQLEQHTEYRIRATAAMIFPVMMHGGLCTPGGSGVAQILKVRLIHATIRNLILRGSPADAVAALGDQQHLAGAGVLAALPAPEGGTHAAMHATLLAHGWKLGEDGLPCNQEELAYTLLTFGYVFLRSLRRQGLGLLPADEEAYLHTWNVMGHVLGIRRELMPDSMAQAQALFAQMQARGRARPVQPDPRPALGEALMATMENVIPWRLLKPFPALMTRYLCGPATAGDIGVTQRADMLSRVLFALWMGVTRCVDTVVRLVLPEFSISRFVTRVLGYHFMSKILLDQTRPLKLPTHILSGVTDTMATWGNDSRAPGWLNRLEDRLTKRGNWTAPADK